MKLCLADSVKCRLVKYPSVIEIFLPALTILFGLEALRVLIPGMAWLIGDRFGLGALQLGPVALVIFGLSFFAGTLKKLAGGARAVVITAGGLGLVRLLMQIQWAEPLVNLILAMVGTVLTGLFLSVYFDGARIRGSGTVSRFSIGILTGLLINNALHGAFGTYDMVWRQGIVPLMISIVLVLALWLLIAAGREIFYGEGTGNADGGKTWPWLAIGPFFFLQLVVFQNIARVAVLTGWDLPFAFGWVLLSQLAGLRAAVWMVRANFPHKMLLTVASGIILIAASVFSAPESAWLAALTVLLGQVALAVLFTVTVDGIGVGETSLKTAGTTGANGTGMVLLVIFLLGYYAVYQISLPYDNAILETAAAAIITICAIAAAVTFRYREEEKPLSWVLPLVALILLALPLAGILSWKNVEPVEGDGFPVKIMTYNLHNGFNTGGDLDLEALALVIEEAAPDIVALQEISRGWLISGRADMLSWLSQRLDMPYVSGPTADPYWGNAILSRYPVAEYDEYELPPRDLFLLRGFIKAKIDIGNGEELNIIATHFHHVGEDTAIRQFQVPVILDAWDGEEKTIVLGDLNAEPDAVEMEMMRQAGFIDSMADVPSPDDYTFSSADPFQRIDYIWLTPDLTVNDVYVPFSKASDHLGVVAEIDG